jgi:hypothetical protein
MLPKVSVWAIPRDACEHEHDIGKGVLYLVFGEWKVLPIEHGGVELRPVSPATGTPTGRPISATLGSAAPTVAAHDCSSSGGNEASAVKFGNVSSGV